MQAIEILKNTFGYDTFRGRQEEVIDHTLGGGHSLVIMPTGMGKSLCYQIPALVHRARNDAALTLVISPLIALMKDQVDALKARGVDATFVNSSLGKKQRLERYRGVAQGRYAIVYVTPERFRKDEFVQAIGKRTVDLLAVDEAHCISEWGHDFRPDYTRLQTFRELLGNPTTIALTATATPEVQADIVEQLGLTDDQVTMFHEGIGRPNLHLDVREVWGEDDKVRGILEVQEAHAGSGIVYFSLIRNLQTMSEALDARNVPHLCYHGRLDARTRKEVQETFMQDPGALVLATNAFGMGIDKESIRFVVHAEVPGSMESYYQEIGRAGRDGLDALCCLLYDQRDLMTQMEFIKWSNPDSVFYQRVYAFLKNDAEKVQAFGIEWLKEKLHHKQGHDFRLETALGMLGRYGVIEGDGRVGRDELDQAEGMTVVGELPAELLDQDRLDAKLKRDQQKLYTMVRYAKHEDSRKDFIHGYFGLALGGA